MKTTMRSLFLLLFAGLLMVPASTAQDLRGDDMVFVRPRVGLSYYFGDTEKSPFTGDGDLFNSFPYNIGLEGGYQLTSAFSLGIGFTYGEYANVTEFRNGLDTEPHPTNRTNIELIGRYLFTPELRFSPFVFFGAHYTFGTSAIYTPGPCLTGAGACPEDTIAAFGPYFGIGFDYYISNRTSFFFESGLRASLPDDQVDGWDGNGFTSADYLGHNVVGLNINLNPFTPVEIVDLVCPADVVETGSPVTFTGSVNENATQPVQVNWTFGDGNGGTGMTVSHTYEREGAFDVSMIATNGNGKARSTMTCSVTAEHPCLPAEIVSMTATNMNPDTETLVRFAADVTGSEATSYSWDFGDGSTSSEMAPSHTFEEAGTYTVTLDVENCDGVVSRSIVITVDPYEAAICSEITEMNPVFFDRNSSALTEEGRASLQDNLDILLLCPNLNARLEGWASAGERRPQELSEDRARAVEQFYVDNGVPASRLVTQGMGRSGEGSKKEGLAQYRRVDTIPVR